jgi:hypothetical protein
MSAAHNEETLFACPVPGCLSNRTLLSRAILELHMRNHEQRSCNTLLALLNCDRNRTCPVGTCPKKLFRYSLLQEHVLQHNEAERTAFSTDIAAAGFDPHNGYVICPILSCGRTFPALPAIHNHLLDHTVTDPNHFRTWKNKASLFVLNDTNPWDAWEFSRYLSLGEDIKLVCPTCREVSKGSGNDRVTHQLDLLKDPKELYGCREQILKLCPAFATHPVFDDVMPIVHRLGWRSP